MTVFTATLRKFGQKGEKTEWTFIDIPLELTDALSLGQKTAFRVKGRLDSFVIQQVALVPMGESADADPDEPTAPFIMAINATMRRGIGKEAGDLVRVELERDDDPLRLSADLLTCLSDEPDALAFFETLTPGHQLYFSNWIESAKTLPTKTKRLHQAVSGLAMKLSYSEMIRHFRHS